MDGVLMVNFCPVCGYADLKYPAYEGLVASDEFCPCCGFQFGWTDYDLGISHEQWRKKWIEGGMRWDDNTKSGRKPPSGWDPRAQLRSINIFL